jgi:virulence-associated protein VagC
MAASDLINNGDWSQAVRIPREVAFQSSMMAPAFAAR